MELYEKYKAQKEQGRLKPWSEVTKADLFQLWVEEAYPNDMIADLWGVDPKEVKNKRYGFGIKQGVMSTNDFESMLIQYASLFKNKISYAAYEAEEKDPQLVAGLRKALELISETIDEQSESYREIAASKS